MKIQAVNTKVLIEEITMHKNGAGLGKVIAKGKDVDDVKKGDNIYFDPYSALQIKAENKETVSKSGIVLGMEKRKYFIDESAILGIEKEGKK